MELKSATFWQRVYVGMDTIEQKGGDLLDVHIREPHLWYKAPVVLFRRNRNGALRNSDNEFMLHE